MRSFFTESVQGFDTLDSAEQLDFMLQNIQDDAQKAGIQVQQLLEANDNLSSARVVSGERTERGFSTSTVNDYNDITAALTQTDMSAQQSLTLIASLDENASKQEILNKIAQIKSEMENNDNNFELALRTTLDPKELQNVKEQVRASISEMEPTDSDINKETFQETARYFQDMAGELEGVSEEVAYNQEELADLAEAVLRYDDALQDADENLANWKDTLSDSSSSMADQADALRGLRDLIGDLLDLDTSNLSTDFMQSAQVLGLLDQAIYGTEEDAAQAYDQLNALASLDTAGLLN